MRPVIDCKVQGIHFYFDVREDITKLLNEVDTVFNVGYNSALEYAMKVALDTYKDTGEYPVKDKYTKENIPVKVVNGLDTCFNELKHVLLTENHLIIVDEADMIFNLYPELTKNIISNSTSNFIIVARSVLPGLKFGYSEHAIMEHADRNEIICRYYDEFKKS